MKVEKKIMKFAKPSRKDPNKLEVREGEALLIEYYDSKNERIGKIVQPFKNFDDLEVEIIDKKAFINKAKKAGDVGMVGSILTGIITVGGIISAATISEVVGPILMVSGFVSYASFLGVSTRAYHYYIWCNKKYQNEINDQISNYNDIKKKK